MNEFASGVYGRLFDDNSGYAYKVFYTENKSYESGWIREIAALKNLSHPNIVAPKYIGFNFSPDPNVAARPSIYIKMKMYKPLLKIKFPICDEDILQMMQDLFNSLTYIHSKFMMHRDIKEANLLYEESDVKNRQVKRLLVCDFSLARIKINTDDIHNFNYLTPETITLSHRPPEVFQSIKSNQLKGIDTAKIEYDERVDIWSAGIALFFILTGLQLYHVVFYYERNNEKLKDFIAHSEELKPIQTKITNGKRLTSADLDKIFTMLILSHNAIAFLTGFLDKYIDKNLKHLEFYKKIFALCVVDVSKRSSALEMLSICNKYILENGISANDAGYMEMNSIPKMTSTRTIQDYVDNFMHNTLQSRLNSVRIRSLIAVKTGCIMSKFCEKLQKSITEINAIYIIAASHIVEILFLYDDVFTVSFGCSRNSIYKYINHIMAITNFLEGVF